MSDYHDLKTNVLLLADSLFIGKKEWEEVFLRFLKDLVNQIINP